MKSLQTLDQREAAKLIEWVVSDVQETRLKPVSIAVVDVHGHPLQAYRMEGASADSFWIALAKAETALRGGKDTAEIAHEFNEEDGWKPKPAHEHRADDNRRAAANPRFVSWAGGCVVYDRDSRIVGAVAVSGLTELDDHSLASAVRDDLLHNARSDFNWEG